MLEELIRKQEKKEAIKLWRRELKQVMISRPCWLQGDTSHAPFLGLEDAQALINILREFNSTAASGGEYQEKIFSCARISPAASEAAFNLLPRSLWALFGFVVSQKFESAVYLGYI